MDSAVEYATLKAKAEIEKEQFKEKLAFKQQQMPPSNKQVGKSPRQMKTKFVLFFFYAMTAMFIQ